MTTFIIKGFARRKFSHYLCRILPILVIVIMFSSCSIIKWFETIIGGQNIYTKDYSQILIETNIYNSIDIFEDLPVLFNRAIYVPGFGIINYIRFNDNCTGDCEINYVPFQGIISSLSFVTILKHVPSLAEDESIMNYFEHDSMIFTSTIRKSDLQKNTDAISQKKGMANYINTDKRSYSKSDYPIYALLEEHREGFTKHNGVGDKMRTVLNIPIKLFKKHGGNVTAVYVPNMFAVLAIDIPLASGDPLQFIPLIMYNEYGLCLYSHINEQANIKLMTSIDSAGGQLDLISWRDYLEEAMDSLNKKVDLDHKAVFFKSGIPYQPTDNP